MKTKNRRKIYKKLNKGKQRKISRKVKKSIKGTRKIMKGGGILDDGCEYVRRFFKPNKSERIFDEDDEDDIAELEYNTLKKLEPPKNPTKIFEWYEDIDTRINTALPYIKLKCKLFSNNIDECINNNISKIENRAKEIYDNNLIVKDQNRIAIDRKKFALTDPYFKNYTPYNHTKFTSELDNIKPQIELNYNNLLKQLNTTPTEKITKDEISEWWDDAHITLNNYIEIHCNKPYVNNSYQKCKKKLTDQITLQMDKYNETLENLLK